MVGAVVQHGLQVHHGIARQGTVGAGLPQALLHRREEVLGHAAAEHLLLKHHLLAVAGLEVDDNVTELAVAAGLLLMAPLLLAGLADGLAVGDTRSLEAISTPNLFFSLALTTSRCCSPKPPMTCWWVSALLM